jgi:hypothetical protein
MFKRLITLLPVTLFFSEIFASELVKTLKTDVDTQSTSTLFIASNYAFQAEDDVNNQHWDVAPSVASAAVLDDSPGFSVELKYSDPTNRGGLGYHFVCDSLFSFNNADKASCYWYDSKTVRIFPNTPSDLPAGSSLTVLANVVASLCPEFVPQCVPVKPTAAQTVSVTIGTLVPAVTVVIHAVTKMPVCSNWLVDLTESTGNYGKDWDTINIDITSSNTAEDLTALKSFISNAFTTSSPFSVGNSFFMVGSFYEITFTLCSATGPTHACGSGLAYLEIVTDGTPVPPTVFIPGGSVKTIKLADSFNLTAVAFVKTCGDSFKTMKSLSYTWGVYGENTNPAFTTSRNPSELHIGPYGFGNIGLYSVTLSVTDESTSLDIDTISVIVHVESAPLIPIITANYPGEMGNPLTLYGWGSIDPDIANNQYDQSQKTFTWTCSQLLPTRGSDCSGLLLAPFSSPDSTPQGVTLSSTAAAVVDTVYQIKFTITKGTRQSATYAAIKVLSFQSALNTFEKYTSMEILKNVNPSDRFYVELNVNFHQTCSLDWVTSNTQLNLVDQAINPITYGLSPPYYNSYFHLYLKSEALQPYSSYTFSLHGTCNFADPIMKLTAITNGPPVEGQLIVSPSAGFEYTTTFLLKTKNWYDNDLPLSYAYGFTLFPEESGLVSLIQDRTYLRYFGTQLPFNSINQAANGITTVVLMVYDSLGMSTKVSFPVAVTRAFPSTLFPDENSFQQQLWNDLISEYSLAVADYVKPVAVRTAMASRLSLSFTISVPFRQNLLTQILDNEYHNVALTDAKVVSVITDLYSLFTQPGAFTSSDLLYTFQQGVVSISDHFSYYYYSFDLKVLSKLMELLDISMSAQVNNPSLYYPIPTAYSTPPMSVAAFADRVIAGYHGVSALTYVRNALTVLEPSIFQHFARNSKILSLRDFGGLSWKMSVPNPSSIVTMNGHNATVSISIPSKEYSAFSTNNVDFISFDSTVIRQNCSSGFKSIIYSPAVHLHMWFASNDYVIATPIQIKLPWSVAAIPANLGDVKCNFYDGITGFVKSSNDICTVSHIDNAYVTCNCIPSSSNGLYDVQQGFHIRVVASSIVTEPICQPGVSIPTLSPVSSPVGSPVALPTLSPINYGPPAFPTLKINVYHNDDYKNPSLNSQANVEIHCISVDPVMGTPTYIRGTYGMRGYFEGSFVSAPHSATTVSAAVNYFEVGYDNVWLANQEADVRVETGAGMLYLDSAAFGYQSGTAFSSGVNSQTNRGSFKSWGITSLCGSSDYGMHSLYGCLGLNTQTTTLSLDDIAKQYCLWDRHHLEENNYNDIPGAPTVAEQDSQHLNILTDLNWKIFSDNNRHGENVNTFQSLNIGFDNEAQLGGVLLGGYRYMYNDQECQQLGCAGGTQGRVECSVLSCCF